MLNKLFHEEHCMLKIPCFLLVTLLVGCSSPSPVKESIPAENAARIRLFGQNGIMIKFSRHRGYGKGRTETVSGGLGGALSSLVGTASNQSIGMPDTPNVKNISERGGILSKAYFREYVVEAGQPLTLSMSYRAGALYCKPIVRTFIPEAGNDYEASLDIEPDFCVSRVNKILIQDNEVVLLPVK
jgi:hypothetical protein